MFLQRDDMMRVAEALGYPRKRPSIDRIELRRQAEAEGREHIRLAREQSKRDKLIVKNALFAKRYEHKPNKEIL